MTFKQLTLYQPHTQRSEVRKYLENNGINVIVERDEEDRFDRVTLALVVQSSFVLRDDEPEDARRLEVQMAEEKLFEYGMKRIKQGMFACGHRTPDKE